MKNLLIITNHSYMLYRFRKELIQSLLKDYKVTIATPYVGHVTDLALLGLECINVKMERRSINPIKDVALIEQYRKIIKQVKPDKVITYSIKPNIYGGLLCSQMHIPYYANVQGLGTAFQKKILSEFVTKLYKMAFRHVHTVFFENEGNRQIFINKQIVEENKTCLLNGAGINLNEYQYHNYPNNEKTHFLFMGRIMKEKGVDELFEAVIQLKEEGYDFVLDLVGFYEDDYKDQVVELSDQGIVIFHGFQSNPIPYYIDTDCVVLPSYHEGMSNVLLEGAAIGRPLITTDIHGCKEAVKDGETGLLVKVKDSQDLYNKIKQFMTFSYEKRQQMGLEGRKHIQEVFDKDQIVNQTIERIEHIGDNE